jgi:hypothetical protein
VYVGVIAAADDILNVELTLPLVLCKGGSFEDELDGDAKQSAFSLCLCVVSPHQRSSSNNKREGVDAVCSKLTSPCFSLLITSASWQISAVYQKRNAEWM